MSTQWRHGLCACALRQMAAAAGVLLALGAEGVAAHALHPAPTHQDAGATAGTVVVERRGGGGVAQGQLRGIGPEGVTLQVMRGGIERQETVPWSEVRTLRGADGAPPRTEDAAQVAHWLAAGDALWRGKQRAQRGDWAFAREPLERAARAWRGAAPCTDAVTAQLACLEAQMQAEHPEEALPVAYEAMCQLRAGATPAAWAQGALALVDAPRGIPAGLPPMAFTDAQAQRAAQGLQEFKAPQDPMLERCAAQYAQLLAWPEPSPVPAPTDAQGNGVSPAPGGGRGAEEHRQGLTLLTELCQALRGDAAQRAQARRNLQTMRRSLPAWCDPWLRMAMGAGLTLEEDPAACERGVLLLLSVPAVDGERVPALAAVARTWAERALEEWQAVPPRSGRAAATRPEEFVGRDHADALGRYLEGQGLGGLLAAHLELQLDLALTQDDRTLLVARLAQLLATQLEQQVDPQQREALLVRSARIVDRFDEGSERLRLELLRSQYRAAQRVAEDRRAGRGEEDRVAGMIEEFRQLARDFETLSRRAEQGRRRTEEEIARAAGLRAEQLAMQAQQQEQIVRSALFFQAWSLYYQAWMQRELQQPQWRDVALAAMAAFARLIEPGKAAVDPGDVSSDLRGNEGFASAVLGAGLTASLVQTGATADAWLALLETPGTHESIRLKLPAWKMASLLDRGEYARALQHLTADGDGPQGGTMALLAAARAARGSGDQAVAALLTEAVARIAGEGRLAELAAMSGVMKEPQASNTAMRGAGARLFEGVRLGAQAQRAQQAGDAQAARAAWAAAAEALDGALGGDAPPAIVAGAGALRGWALRGAGRFREAAEAFVASAERSSGERAGDTLWNAVLCFDEAARQGDAEATDRGRELVDRLVRDLPQTAAAVRGHAWRVIHAQTPALEDIEALLAPGVNPELAQAARSAALDGLYRRFRTLHDAERVAAARRALAVGSVAGAAPGADGLVQLRRRVEMAISLDDARRASEALAAVEARARENQGLQQELAPELAARRAQVAALEHAGAEAIAAARDVDPESVWGRVAWRAARDAVARDPGAGPAQRALVARAVVQGRGSAESPRVEDLVAWANAEAELLAGGGTGDAAGAAAALEQALGLYPQNVDLGLADATLRWARGDREGAKDVLHRVLSRTPAGTPAWFAAKAMQVGALADEDPARARQVLEQVRQLGNGFGQGAPARRLQELDARLPGGGR